MKPTFACVLRSGGDYYPEHVRALAQQVKNNTTIPYEFVCYSDTRIKEVKTVDLKGSAPGWWAVPEVFRQKGPTVVTGVDTVIWDNIDELFKIALNCGPKDFWMIRAFNPNNDFASGVMCYNGDWSCIYKEFNYVKAARKHAAGGEQEHTKEVLKRHGVRPKVLQDVFSGIASYKKQCRHKVPRGTKVILFHGKPRPWEVGNLWGDVTGEGFGEVEQIWPDSTVYIIGGGPSLNEMDLSLLEGKKVLGVNQAFKLDGQIDVPITYSGDRRWYHWQINRKLKDYKGILYTSYPYFSANPLFTPINLKRKNYHGISNENRNTICWNGNSGASAINVAYWLGAKRVVLLGFDMGRRREKFNWHRDYPKVPEIDKETGRPKTKSDYRRFLKCWDAVARDAKRLGLEILNATPGGNLHKFKRVELGDICKTPS